MTRTVFCLAVLAAVAILPASADIQNGQFQGNAGTCTSLFAGDTFAGNAWTVIGTQSAISVVSWCGSYWQRPPSGGNSVDLDGEFKIGGITQTDTFLPGTYLLTFYLAGNPGGPPSTKNLTVTAGSTVEDFSFTLPAPPSTSEMGWVLESLYFTATGGSTTITFQSTDPTDSGYGPVVGDVSASPVPEADYRSYFALFVGVSGVLMLVRRKRQA